MATVLTNIKRFDLSLSLQDFSQGQFEKYQIETIKASRDAYVLFTDQGSGVTASAKVRGEVVRSAIRNGIISVGITPEEVDGLKPYLVEWLADEIRKHVTQVTTAPADPN